MIIKKFLKKMTVSLFCVLMMIFVSSIQQFILPQGVIFSNNDSVSALSMGEGAKAAQGNDQAESLFAPNGLFQKISNIALFLLGAVSVLMLIYGGIRYTISGGDSGAISAAKNTILYAIVGIVVALLAYAIVGFVINALSSGTTKSTTPTTVKTEPAPTTPATPTTPAATPTTPATTTPESSSPTTTPSTPTSPSADTTTTNPTTPTDTNHSTTTPTNSNTTGPQTRR